MLSFSRLNRGMLLIFVGLFFATTLPIIWIFYNRPEGHLYVVLEILNIIMLWIAAFTILSFDSKRWEEAYAAEKLLADFTRNLVFPAVLRQPYIGDFVTDRLVRDILRQPEEWRPVASTLDSSTTQAIELCRERIEHLSREASLEAQNGEVPGSAEHEMQLRKEICELEALIRMVKKR